MHLLLAVGLAALVASIPASRPQPAVKASAAWIQVESGGSEATAFVTVDNATMYDIYIVGAQTEAADTVELRDTPAGTAAPVAVKEVPVAAYGRLEMSSNAVHLSLKSLRRPLAAGDTVDLVIYTDGGEQLRIAVTVK